ncbi:MAG: glycosyltransferase family 2 protein [Coriobacteriales bacterium]|jgi:glucosyltransferase
MAVKISVIVPCYNEEAALPIFYKEATKVFNQMNCSYELLLVNDGSKDNTLSAIKTFVADDDHVKYISFSRNFGKESAMYAGFCNAIGDYVAVMDADMQDPPALLPQMLEILENSDYDSVATRREDRKGEPPIRSFFARKFYKIINRVSDADVVDGARDFRLMKREMVDAIISMSEYNRFSKGIFGWVGFKTYWMPYENVERVAGKTKWNFWKLFKYAISGIINFSQAPLDMVSYIGAFSTIGSLIALIVIIVKKLVLGDPVQGWASMVCIVIFMSGLILFCLGIIGQYIAKIYMETKDRPHYIASESNIQDIKKIK